MSIDMGDSFFLTLLFFSSYNQYGHISFYMSLSDRLRTRKRKTRSIFLFPCLLPQQMANIFIDAISEFFSTIDVWMMTISPPWLMIRIFFLLQTWICQFDFKKHIFTHSLKGCWWEKKYKNLFEKLPINHSWCDRFECTRDTIFILWILNSSLVNSWDLRIRPHPIVQEFMHFYCCTGCFYFISQPQLMKIPGKIFHISLIIPVKDFLYNRVPFLIVPDV